MNPWLLRPPFLRPCLASRRNLVPHWSMDLGRKLPEELHILEAGHRFEVERSLEAAHMPAVVGRILKGHEFN